MKRQAELSGTERAFVQMVVEEHAALVRNADQNRARRMSVLLSEKGIPDGVPVNFNGEALEYESPDISVASPQIESLDAAMHEMESRVAEMGVEV